MFTHHRYVLPALFCITIGLGLLSCRKMVSVPEPINSITTAEVFTSDAQATSAMAGIYTQLINGQALSFSNGYITLLAGMSSDELFYYGIGDLNILAFSPNQLLNSNSYTSEVWTSAYKTIYGANSVIEGIAASTSDALTDSVRKELTAEAKFVRAFAYFYLTNLFGDVPLALTVDFNKTRYMARTPVKDVYRQIIQDLKDAQSLLPPDYSAAANSGYERIVPNRWAATALLARAYLYTKDYANAAAQATSVINNTTLYSLESDPKNVFLVNSREAIWQLKQGTDNTPYQNATVEGFTILPSPQFTGVAHYCLAAPLLNAFEPGDLRRSAWVDSTSNNATGFTWYPFKYKTGPYNAALGAPSTEYYMVLRLAEMYLVRAEAEVNDAAGGAAAAISDLNVIRSRAGLPALSSSLLQPQIITAVAHERQVELFAEWGHRWLDLNRTGQAHIVLSAFSGKQPWAGDYQLLYPIPPAEIRSDHFLVQNPGY
ncbi:RagB/SusD family nutrient uptake outer membrane protein [Flavitalea sp. BT771]|uniref:RagB/SusD family nutrient uptake outer membrane protein n=1 Tax=Flavitalea sp. BT771 TaxID=3063329 RepID=UPI0026E37976|nr:RagB/SusD family nutrient uptake outer membrane protein [Flavitalea sp. BT771]MDO6434763.1 RagB/SusD family nutrient uptake outer membrane protein [Flavitalea sp. BT771]MDV6223663.1 RagB/SusD family nutrient uptake outer membrane protein [Flavitalea sp. BT771]